MYLGFIDKKANMNFSEKKRETISQMNANHNPTQV